MSKEVVAEVIALIELGMIAPEDIVKCLRKANSEPEKALAAPTTTETNGGKTGWPPGLLQDDSKGLSKWLSNQPDAKLRVRETLAEQPAQRTWVGLTDELRAGAEPMFFCGAKWAERILKEKNT